MARKKRTVNKKRPPNKTAPSSTGLSRYFNTSTRSWAVYICVVVLGCAVQQRWSTNNVRQFTAAEKYKRFTAAFPAGGKVEVRNVTAAEDGSNDNDAGWGAGTFATSDIAKGEVIMRVDRWDILPTYAMMKERWYQQLTLLVEAALAPYNSDARPQKEHVLTAMVLLMEVDNGKKSRWHSYIEALPANVSQMAWYWTDDEMRCVVPWHFAERTTAEMLRIRLRNYHVAFEEVSRKFTPLARLAMSSRIQLRERAEWAYLMVLTRAFGSGTLEPMLDMANHDPTRSDGVAETRDGSSLLVATRDIAAGEQVFNSYGSLFPTKMAAMYGFVDPNAAYVYVPSLTADMQKSPRTSSIEACTQAHHQLFFGNVTEGRVGANAEDGMIYYKSFRPTELAYQCARVLLQSEDGPTIPRYLAEKLLQDAVEYEAMASADHCQSARGSFPLIRKANAVTARLLRGALDVARQAERGEIEYPDIPYQY